MGDCLFSVRMTMISVCWWDRQDQATQCCSVDMKIPNDELGEEIFLIIIGDGCLMDPLKSIGE